MASSSPVQTAKRRGRPAQARDRIMRTAYDLFLKNGIRATGIDAIIVGADVARMTFYRNFGAKDDLVLAFLDEHGRRWTDEWLKREVLRRHAEPRERLLGMFDLHHEWFQQRRFEGCPFIKTLLETGHSPKIRLAAARHMADVRQFIEGFVKETGLKGASELAANWHMLLKGAIVAASQGNRDAARTARQAAAVLLAYWDRRGLRAS